MATISRKKKKVKVTPEGAVHIKASFNNIMVTITDVQGNTVSWSSAGKNGFKGSKKNTPYASQVTSESAAKEAYDLGMRHVNVFIKGPGAGRDGHHAGHVDQLTRGRADLEGEQIVCLLAENLV